MSQSITRKKIVHTDMPFSTDDWQWLGDFLKRRGLPGMAVAVADGDELAISHSVGWAELRKRAIDEDTLFELGSIGKTFTALLAAELLDLEAPLTDYLPWFEVRSAYDPIRVEHLLTHSAGLIRGAEMTADSRFDVWALRDTETGFAPGERFYYSNVGYRILGYALEAATGTPYRELLTSRSSSRSGSSTRSRRSPSRSVTGWRWGTTACTTTARLRRTTPSSRRRGSRTGTADGSLASTAGDLAAFGRSADGPARGRHLGATARLRRTGGATATGLERKGEPRPSRRLDARLRLDVARRSRLGNRRRRAHERARRARGDGGSSHSSCSTCAVARIRTRPATPSRGHPTARRPSRSPSTPPSTAATGATTPGFRAFASSSGRAGSRLRWPGETTSRSPGSARHEFRVGEEEWSPERLRFDAVVSAAPCARTSRGEGTTEATSVKRRRPQTLSRGKSNDHERVKMTSPFSWTSSRASTWNASASQVMGS